MCTLSVSCFHVMFLCFYFYLTDKNAAHHLPKVRDIIENTGTILMYLPPYSLQLNSIEGVFSVVKHWLRRHDNILMTTNNPEYLVYRSSMSIDSETVKSFYSNCSYN